MLNKGINLIPYPPIFIAPMLALLLAVLILLGVELIDLSYVVKLDIYF